MEEKMLNAVTCPSGHSLVLHRCAQPRQHVSLDAPPARPPPALASVRDERLQTVSARAPRPAPNAAQAEEAAMIQMEAAQAAAQARAAQRAPQHQPSFADIVAPSHRLTHRQPPATARSTNSARDLGQRRPPPPPTLWRDMCACDLCGVAISAQSPRGVCLACDFVACETCAGITAEMAHEAMGTTAILAQRQQEERLQRQYEAAGRAFFAMVRISKLRGALGSWRQLLNEQRLKKSRVASAAFHCTGRVLILILTSWRGLVEEKRRRLESVTGDA